MYEIACKSQNELNNDNGNDNINDNDNGNSNVLVALVPCTLFSIFYVFVACWWEIFFLL